MHNQHVIYNSKEGKWCCKCYEVPAEKQIINEGEWNKLFKKEDDINCQIGNTNCCCQYSVRNGIKCTDIEDVSVLKIFNVAGPIAVLNKIERDAFLYFLKWTVDGEPLRRMLTNLLKIIEDKMFYGSIATFETTAKQSDARKWIARHLRKQKKKFEDLTTEENNYLVVVHGLTQIVYPIIKNEFNTQCPDHVLDEIRLSINDKQLQLAKTRRRDGKSGRKKGIHLTPDHQRQLFSQTSRVKN
ncbi:unnamed protein product [Mytilus coruscus]|uniref:Uncharacterized protein n=1 Tax=Mytilus coruscus TaxID=42192 RepID=A0A6J8DPB2_MYTCO|nr:unnamed protein product [Mytilus coruscus]